MIKIRYGVFETNSSSTHSLTIVEEDKYNKWRNGETKFSPKYENFLDKDKSDKENLFLIETNSKFDINVEYKNDEGNTVIDIDKTIKKILEDEDLGYDFDIEKFYMTPEQYSCYVYSHYPRQEIVESNIVDGKSIVVFGYYGEC